MEDFAIKVEGVSKVFRLPYEKNSSIKSAFINFYRREKGYELQRALKSVSFEVKKGEFFGIVGRNGSGKSTMLKILAGIYSPSKGNIQVKGNLTPFIELGVGFNPELTGRENVYLNGALLGFNRKEMQSMYKDIVKFAELEKFMDQKLKNYSSGMQVRLAFSIAIRAHTDILLIDEVLAVGDAAFQAKSFDVFRSMKKEGKTIIFVSHDLSSVKEFCDRTVVLDKGDLVYEGDTDSAVDFYLKRVLKEEQEKNPYSSDQLAPRVNNKAKISNGRLENSKGEKTKLINGRSFVIKFDAEFFEDALNPNPGVIFFNQLGLQVNSANASWASKKIGLVKKGEKVTFAFKFPNFLENGHYKILANIHQDESRIYAWENNLLNVECNKPYQSGSIVNSPYDFFIEGKR